MARFDVYTRRDGPGYLLDCQADILDGLNTRLVAPLLPERLAPKPAGRLNPMFEIEGERHVMVTQFAAAIPVRELGRRVMSLAREDATISNAIDMLLIGC
jgi:toxin CcdB